MRNPGELTSDAQVCAILEWLYKQLVLTSSSSIAYKSSPSTSLLLTFDIICVGHQNTQNWGSHTCRDILNIRDHLFFLGNAFSLFITTSNLSRVNYQLFRCCTMSTAKTRML